MYGGLMGVRICYFSVGMVMMLRQVVPAMDTLYRKLDKKKDKQLVGIGGLNKYRDTFWRL